ncbi:AcrR family transcriptional regulator [Mycobacterium sp. MAA66]
MHHRSLESADVQAETPVGDDRDCLIDAAFYCLSHPELGPASIAAMLARAGVSARVFYRYFVSKDELFLAMLTQENNALVGRLDDIAADTAVAPAVALESWIIEMFERVEDPVRARRSAVLMTDEVRAARGYREFRCHADSARHRSLVQILTRGRQDKSFPVTDPAADAVSIDAVCDHAVSNLIARNTGKPGFGVAHVVGFALRSLGAVRSSGG